jgi:hypothetical protein
MSDLPGRLRNQAEGLLDEWNSEELALLLTEAADTIGRQAAVIGRVEAFVEKLDEMSGSVMFSDDACSAYGWAHNELRAALGDEK